MTIYLILIFIGILGILVLLSIPIIIIWYVAYICFFETSTREIDAYSWLHSKFCRYFLEKLPSPQSSQVVFRDKEAIDKHSAGGKQILYALHPHGMIAQGRLLHIIHSSSELYPYFVRSYQAIHSFAFRIPFMRELLLSGRCIPAHESFLDTFITQGNNISIFPGGVREIKYCSMKDGDKRDYYYLKKRRGFIRIALKHKMAIVPVLFWEDQQTFTYERTPAVKSIEKSIKFITDYSVDLGIFQMFRWKNIRQLWNMITGKCETQYVYIGAPIEFAEGTPLEDAHTRYIQAIRELHTFAKQDRGSDRELVIT